MGNSFYVQISPYLLLEYIYGDSSSTYISNQVKLAKIQNSYQGGQIQFLNNSASSSITQNVLNNSVANIGGYKWVYLGTDVPVPYINTDPKLVYTDMSTSLTSLYVMYDTVRIHIVSGYRLEDLQGLIVQIYGREAISGNTSILANSLYLNSSSRDILNSRPILLGDQMYDRYIDVLIPSLKYINTEFFNNPANPYSIGYQYTTDHNGFLYNSAIYVKVYEIKSLNTTNGITYLNTSDSYEVNVNQEDLYSSLSAHIEEATDGDYFNYYPTYGGDFVDQFIADLNSSGGDYVIINDIEVYEQIGAEQILSFSFSQVQQSGFDGPLTYRPILKHAGTSVSFSIDYTVRIYNKVNSFQIIRRASTTSFNPRKYGKQLQKIALADQAYPLKVYNKVYGNSPVTFTGTDYTSSFNTVYLPVFYERRNLVVQHKTLLANGTNPVNTDFYQSIYFGQGDAMIYLSDFDSYFKFIVAQIDAKSGALTYLDLTAGNISIAFKDASGNTIKIPSEPSDATNSQAKGELVFHIPGSVKSKVLYTGTTTVPFYLLTESSGSAETLLYSGLVDNITNISKETSRAQTIATAIQSTSNTTSVAVNTSSTIIGATSVSLLQTLTAANSASVSSLQSDQVQSPTIPNYNYDNGSSTIKSALTPVSQTNKSVSQQQVSTKLSQKTGTSTTLNT